MEGKERVICVAHRGGAGSAPENTLAAFKRAIAAGVDMVECDIHLTKDGHMVVIHDDQLDRTTNGKGLVREKTLADLKALDAGSWYGREYTGERIPTLEELLDLAQGKVDVIIEIKNGPYYYKGIEEKLVDLLRARGMKDRVVIISFDHACLKKIHGMEPKLRIGILFSGTKVDYLETARDTGAVFLGPCWQMVTPQMLKEAHERNLKVNLWTVNTSDQMRLFIDMNVDAITTDRPDLLLKELGR